MFTLHPQLANDTATLGDLTLCRVLLMNDAQYPWIILVPRRDNLTELYQLNATDRQRYQVESAQLAQQMMTEFSGDKFNVAALGNAVPQLHIHHIVRFKNDAAWPTPVWGVRPVQPYSEQALRTMIQRLRTLLSASFDDFQAG